MNIIFPFIILVGFMLLGVPIAFALAGAGIIGIWSLTGSLNSVITILGTVPFRTVNDYILTTVPMFILMAYFAARGGLAHDLYSAASNWLSDIRGGLAIATVFACAIFGAMSGAAIASAAVMSSISYPHMRRFGYSEMLSAGVVAVGSVLAILIPPSVAMVVYGVATDTSIGKLLIAGVLPGILLGIILALNIFIWVCIQPSAAPKIQPVLWSERLSSLQSILPSLLMIFIVIGFLYAGICTPTEVGAVGAFTAVVIAKAMNRLSWDDAIKAMKDTIRSSGMILMIFIGATIFGLFITMSQVPQYLVKIVAGMNLDRHVVIIAIIIAYFIISMFMDEIPLLLMTLPVTFPLIRSLGFDAVWFGVISMMMIAMGLVFPPVGMCAFVVSSVAKADLKKVYQGASILLLSIIATTALLIIFPQIALWLPSRMR